MKKLLFVIHTLEGGGAEKVLVNLVNNLPREKYKITVAGVFDGGVNKRFLKDDIEYIVLLYHLIVNRRSYENRKKYSHRFFDEFGIFRI